MSYLADLLGSAYKEGMTEDEISSALESINTNGTNEITKLKTALSKANSEASNFKKQLREKMSTEEAEKIARDEERQNLLDENAQLKRTIDLTDKTNKLLSIGYDEKLAESTAIAMVDGDFDTVLANQTKFVESQKQTILADQMRNTPRPATGAATGGVDYNAKIEQAKKENNFAEVAYYTRLAATDTTSE